MPLSRQQIKDRIEVILKKQSRLENLVSKLQDRFFEEVLADYSFIIESPKNYSQFFVRFTKDFHAPILRQLLEDLRYIVQDNLKYFLDESDLQGIDEKMKVLEVGLMKEVEFYTSEIANDTRLKSNFRTALLKFNNKDRLTDSQKEELDLVINGSKETRGIWESYYYNEDKNGGSIFDSYQRADRLAQNTFAETLKMQCAMYVGGTITGSREFCIERNGKIFLRTEIESWRNLNFQGKPKVNYEPAIDLGGYRCRHHLSWLGNATAIRLDETLKLNDKGNLYRV